MANEQLDVSSWRKLQAGEHQRIDVIFYEMADVIQDEPVLLLSPWNQVAVAIWQNGAWRYGPRPGETWDASYPIGWARIHACGWVSHDSVAISLALINELANGDKDNGQEARRSPAKGSE